MMSKTEDGLWPTKADADREVEEENSDASRWVLGWRKPVALLI